MSEFIIGLTGGVASGKSEVSRHFEALGIVVADADQAARDAERVHLNTLTRAYLD